MKYCVPYTRASAFPYFDEVDELEIVFNMADSTLPQFLEKYNEKTIIIDITEDEFNKDWFNLLSALYEKYGNFILSLRSTDSEWIEPLKENNIPFTFYEYATSWDRLYSILETGACAVTVAEEICFNIKSIAKVAHSYGAKVRLFPNVAQSCVRSTPAIKQFFIRPEDIDLYEPYVDTCVLFKSSDNLSAYYEAYTKDKYWFGDLNEFIIGYYDSLDSRCIVSGFGEMRLECGKTCFKGGPCAVCDRSKELADLMNDKNLILK